MSRENVLRDSYFHVQNGGLHIELVKKDDGLYVRYRVRYLNSNIASYLIELQTPAQIDEMIDQLQSAKQFLSSCGYKYSYLDPPSYFAYTNKIFIPQVTITLDKENNRTDLLIEWLQENITGGFKVLEQYQETNIEFEQVSDALLFKLSY